MASSSSVSRPIARLALACLPPTRKSPPSNKPQNRFGPGPARGTSTRQPSRRNTSHRITPRCRRIQTRRLYSDRPPPIHTQRNRLRRILDTPPVHRHSIKDDSRPVRPFRSISSSTNRPAGSAIRLPPAPRFEWIWPVTAFAVVYPSPPVGHKRHHCLAVLCPLPRIFLQPLPDYGL
jgi:hypothetical protein